MQVLDYECGREKSSLKNNTRASTNPKVNSIEWSGDQSLLLALDF
jgi:hypothetical protein